MIPKHKHPHKIIPIDKLFFNYSFSLKEIIFIWGVLVFNLLILVNLFLKTFWGRSRPGDITEFGGVENFSAWHQFSDSCLSNCSFVSGDSAVGFSIIILFLITKKQVYMYLTLVFGFLLGFVRIAEGGHFFSDVIFSAIIVMLVSLFLNKFFYKRLYDS